ncbi:transcription factor Tfb2-domain-containing protein [Kalaharituber pfeilii]|nr:transcription factor Tfb2-domain-containing protein [Kalaharituber pfeilii]
MSGSLRSFDYLEGLPQTVFRRLYQQPCTTLAIFRRMLPHLAKSFVMAMLYHEGPMSISILNNWVNPESVREKEEAFGKLRKLHIIFEKDGHLSLDRTFRDSFRMALTGGGNHRSFGVPCTTPDKRKVDIAFLDDYATRQWEAILHYMVGTRNDVQPGSGVIQLLLKSGLMEKAPNGQAEITQQGFSFLLQDANAQLWTLLLQYLDMAEELRMDPVEVLHFLMMLGSLELGQDYSKETLTPTQRHMLEDLREYGIVYSRKSSSQRFYPTRLATSLTSEVGTLRSVAAGFNKVLQNASSSEGFVVIETNYRLYAYTDSPLQIAVLSLFTRLNSRYPNMVSGRISRQSVRAAIKTGITADQIIDYLTAHAHPQLRKNTPILPPTVVDQIRLWQIEGERMKPTPGYLLKDFATTAEYEATVKYAEELGVLVWKSDAKRSFFVTRYEQVGDFIKRRTAASKKQAT